MSLTQHYLTFIESLCVKFQRTASPVLWDFLSFRTNTENASFQNNEHRWYLFKRFA